MSWNTLTTTQITNEILPDEVAILNTVQGSSSLLEAVLTRVVNQYQQVILQAGNQIGQPGTVPDQCLGDFIAIVRWEWFCGLPATDLQSKFRKDQYDRALEHFARIRGDDGKPREKVEIPANPQTAAGADSRVEVVRGHHGPGPGTFARWGET